MVKSQSGQCAPDRVSPGLGKTKVVLGDNQHSSGRGRSSLEQESSPGERSLGNVQRDGHALKSALRAEAPTSASLSHEQIKDLSRCASSLKRPTSSSVLVPERSVPPQLTADY